VPWVYDDEACDVLRFFTKLKCSLMPYLWSAAVQAHQEGIPTMRAMLLEFPGDPACDTLDRQYLLGGSLLVAPVFAENGAVDFYLPAGRWTHLLSGEVREGRRWYRERHDVLSLPLYVRPGTLLATGGCDDRPDYDYATGLTLTVYELAVGERVECHVYDLDGQSSATVTATREARKVIFEIDGTLRDAGVAVAGGPSAKLPDGARHFELSLPSGD
jgi:alpha-D-xyloside xylohydrolase